MEQRNRPGNRTPVEAGTRPPPRRARSPPDLREIGQDPSSASIDNLPVAVARTSARCFCGPKPSQSEVTVTTRRPRRSPRWRQSIRSTTTISSAEGRVRRRHSGRSAASSRVIRIAERPPRLAHGGPPIDRGEGRGPPHGGVTGENSGAGQPAESAAGTARRTPRRRSPRRPPIGPVGPGTVGESATVGGPKAAERCVSPVSTPTAPRAGRAGPPGRRAGSGQMDDTRHRRRDRLRHRRLDRVGMVTTGTSPRATSPRARSIRAPVGQRLVGQVVPCRRKTSSLPGRRARAGGEVLGSGS